MQTVFGEGPERAVVMFVGEQPGDAEDVAGHPFVGPAGKLLDRCLAAAGIDCARTCVTNAVKHFKWVARGPRRRHRKPSLREVEACHPWLEAEIRTVAPKTVARPRRRRCSGKAFRVTKERGRVLRTNLAPLALATVHPSSLPRAPDEATRHRETERLIADLRVVGGRLR
jgi:DNA polymerase